ncbi:MAG TPA: DegT/DnrJ/EryC1/StrS family aminotransferase [Acidimicrobiales bacterium]|nr:DegT/DnrJ/EryC1/StrS family aminotransferase [Acidimicrobiales bacterium]
MTQRLAVDGGEPVRTTPLDFAKGAALLGDEEKAAVMEVLESRSLFRYYGPDLLGRVARFEAALASLTGAAYAVATSSGTAALRCALAALGIGCGDEVVVPAFTFIATVNAVVLAGAVPVFAEVDDSLGLDAEDVEAKLSPRTAAVVAVHLENVACDMDPLLAVTAPAGLVVIEDAAQSMGVTYRGRGVGSVGDIGAFSLQLEKNVTAGEGGAVTTSDESLHVRAARYQDQGGQFVTSSMGTRGDELDEPFVGENLRMTEVAGAIADVQLSKLPGLLDRLRRTHERVAEGVGPVAGMEPRRVPDPEGQGGSSLTWFLADPALARRFAKALRAEGVPSAQMYGGRPVYLTPSILGRRTASMKGGPWNCAAHPTEVEYRPGLCPRTEDLVARSIIVPIGQHWSARDCDDVVEAVHKVASHLLD